MEEVINLYEVSAYDLEALNPALFPAVFHYKNLLTQPPQNRADQFRQRRHEAWLKTALATLFHASSTENILHFWSRSTDSLITDIWNQIMPPADNLCLIAFGKWGANELNLSSDIDILVLAEDTVTTNDLHFFREFLRQVSEHTPMGFCYRVDADLRPGGRFSPLVSSLQQAINHYWGAAALWERLALVRARWVCGNKSLADSFFEKVLSFIYRKYLDYTLLEELKYLRTRIHQEAPRPDGTHYFHLKLGQGGIRDIELYINALQVIHGGKHKDLQTTSTFKAFTALEKHKILKTSNIKQLQSAYSFFRDLENFVQCLGDHQTHTWSSDLIWPPLTFSNESATLDNTNFSSAPQKIGFSSHQQDRGFFSEPKQIYQQIQTHAHFVDSFISDLLGAPLDQQSRLPENLEDQQSWLSQMGFNNESQTITWPQLFHQKTPHHKKLYEEKARLHFLYEIVSAIHTINIEKDRALSLLLDFVKSIKSKSTLFSLVAGEPLLISDLAHLFSSSPYLANIITRRPELLDSFLLKRVDLQTSDLESFLQTLLDKKLLSLVFSTTTFIKDNNISALNLSLTKTADEICRDLFAFIKASFSDSSLNILCLGKWGGQELGLQSDLDFIFFTDGPPTPDDHKIARKFLSYLTQQARGGRIYDTDLRLRPSGHAGPIISSRQHIEDFLQNKAEAWQRQSYLKMRPLLNQKASPPPQFTASSRGLDLEDQKELIKIRQKFIHPLSTENVNIKDCPGGLIEVEFAAQNTFLYEHRTPKSPNTLSMLEELTSSSPSWSAHGQDIIKNYSFLRKVEQLYYAFSNHSEKHLDVRSEAFHRLLLQVQMTSEDFIQKIHGTVSQNAQYLHAVDPIFMRVC